MHPICIYVACRNGEIRYLEVGSLTGVRGTLQICYNNRFGTLCSDGWDLNEAVVACGQGGKHSKCQQTLRYYVKLSSTQDLELLTPMLTLGQDLEKFILATSVALAMNHHFCRALIAPFIKQQDVPTVMMPVSAAIVRVTD